MHAPRQPWARRHDGCGALAVEVKARSEFWAIGEPQTWCLFLLVLRNKQGYAQTVAFQVLGVGCSAKKVCLCQVVVTPAEVTIGVGMSWFNLSQVRQKLLHTSAGGWYITRKTLHGRIMNMVLPCVLILAAMILFYYCHVTAHLGTNTARGWGFGGVAGGGGGCLCTLPEVHIMFNSNRMRCSKGTCSIPCTIVHEHHNSAGLET